MADFNIPILTGEETAEELIQVVAKMQKLLNWVMQGRISSTNIREIGQWVTNEDGSALMSDITSYPRVVLDPKNNMLKFYTSANVYLNIGAFGTGNVPFLEFRDLAASLSAIINLGSFLQLQSQNRLDVQATTGDINLSALVGSIRLLNTTRVNFNDLIDTATGKSLTTLLGEKATKATGISGTVYTAATSGGAVTKAVTFLDGVRTS